MTRAWLRSLWKNHSLGPIYKRCPRAPTDAPRRRQTGSHHKLTQRTAISPRQPRSMTRPSAKWPQHAHATCHMHMCMCMCMHICMCIHMSCTCIGTLRVELSLRKMKGSGGSPCSSAVAAAVSCRSSTNSGALCWHDGEPHGNRGSRPSCHQRKQRVPGAATSTANHSSRLQACCSRSQSHQRQHAGRCNA